MMKRCENSALEPRDCRAGLAIMSIVKHVISPSLDQVAHISVRQLGLQLEKPMN